MEVNINNAFSIILKLSYNTLMKKTTDKMSRVLESVGLKVIAMLMTSPILTTIMFSVFLSFLIITLSVSFLALAAVFCIVVIIILIIGILIMTVVQYIIIFIFFITLCVMLFLAPKIAYSHYCYAK